MTNLIMPCKGLSVVFTFSRQILRLPRQILALSGVVLDLDDLVTQKFSVDVLFCRLARHARLPASIDMFER